MPGRSPLAGLPVKLEMTCCTHQRATCFNAMPTANTRLCFLLHLCGVPGTKDMAGLGLPSCQRRTLPAVVPWGLECCVREGNRLMSDVMSVARYVLSNTGYISTMKLQKLVYCSQVASLGATGRLLFPERIKAWANGPVAPRLFRAHRGRYVVDASDLDCASVRPLSQQEKALVDGVLD